MQARVVLSGEYTYEEVAAATDWALTASNTPVTDEYRSRAWSSILSAVADLNVEPMAVTQWYSAWPSQAGPTFPTPWHSVPARFTTASDKTGSVCNTPGSNSEAQAPGCVPRWTRPASVEGPLPGHPITHEESRGGLNIADTMGVHSPSNFSRIARTTAPVRARSALRCGDDRTAKFPFDVRTHAQEISNDREVEELSSVFEHAGQLDRVGIAREVVLPGAPLVLIGEYL